MPVYVYRGRNTRTNESITGERFSNTAQQLAAVLRREMIAPVSIQEKKAKEFSLLGFLRRRVSQSEVAIFTRQFSVMLDAGLPLVQCLEAIGEQHSNLAFKGVLEQVRIDVEGGSTLAGAMGKHPKVFDSLYTNMIAAGETGGILDTILQRLAVFIEKIVKLKRALRSAMIYPGIILSIAVIVVTIILWKVIPVFRTLFEGFNVQLPLPTRIVIGVSSFVSSFLIFIVIAAGLAVFGLHRYYKTEKGRYAIDRFLLRVPILGDIFRKIGVARFTRTLATLLSSGVAILEALDITANTAGNAILEETIRKIRRNIEEGKTINEPMKESKFFPSMVTQMVSVGETTGELDNMLVKVADYYEEEVDVVVTNLLVILEPVLLVFLGVVVGGIVISMYLPLFKLIQVLSGA
jgi:type IV pilus assembly protein PilC